MKILYLTNRLCVTGLTRTALITGPDVILTSMAGITTKIRHVLDLENSTARSFMVGGIVTAAKTNKQKPYGRIAVGNG